MTQLFIFDSEDPILFRLVLACLRSVYFFFFESSELQGIFDEVVADLLSLPLFFSFLSFQLRYSSHILEVCSCYCRKGCRGLMMNGLAK